MNDDALVSAAADVVMLQRAMEAGEDVDGEDFNAAIDDLEVAVKNARGDTTVRGNVFNAVVMNLARCDVCGADVGDPCRTPRWKTRRPHRGRRPA